MEGINCLPKFIYERKKKMEIKNLKRYIEQVKEHAWFGGFTTIEIRTRDEVIEIKGYVIEKAYESFATASKITLNNECLFGTDSRSISNYNNEVYNFGKFTTMDEALNYVLEILKNKDYTISYK